MDEIYAIAAVATVLAAIAGYLLERRRDDHAHELVRDLTARLFDFERRICMLEAELRQEVE